MNESTNKIARTARRLAALAMLAAGTLFACAGTAGDISAQREDQLKAAYLLNFVKFVEWPPTDASSALTICFLGGASIHDALAPQIESKRAANRPLVLRRLESSASADGCNTLYLDAASPAANVYPAAASPATLTVSDAKGFLSSGGMIELFTDSNRLRFNVNTNNAQKAGLRISSNLLRLAAVVERGNVK